MLLSYKVKNFCSFKDEAVFTMKPGKVIERFTDNVTFVNKQMKVLKTALIVGENAGGKTSFIKSLQFLKYLFESDKNVRLLKDLSFNYEKDLIQSFELVVLINQKTIYTYNLEIDKFSILSESLKIRTANQNESFNKVVFSCKRTKCSEDGDAVDVFYEAHMEKKYFSSEIVKVIDSRSTAGSGLYVSFLALIELDIVFPFFNWVKESLIVEVPNDFSLNVYKKMEEDEEDLKIMKKDTFLEIFSMVDSSIIEIEVNEEKPFEKTMITRKTINGERFKIEIEDESSGVKEFFAWSIQLWKVLYRDAVLFADEVDKVLNPILSEKIIKFVQGTEHKGQFIFSTHNILHLDTNNFMKEQINFITKKKETLSSELYSLADFKDYRYEKANVYSLYLKGILGGVPND